MKTGAVATALALFAGIGLFFDNFVRGAATQMLQITLSDISKGAEVAVQDATQTLDVVVANNSAICTAEFMDGVRQTLQRSIYVRQILVENSYGARYCSGLEVDFDYRVMSDELPIPGRSETLAAVRLLGSELNLLRITYRADENRIISAFVHFAPILATGQLPGISSWGDVLSVEFTDGTSLWLRGDPSDFNFSAPTGGHIYAEALALDVPIRTLGSVPIGVVRSHYQYMYLGVLFVAFVGLCLGLYFALRRISGLKSSAQSLDHAINAGEIVPYYQPVIDLSSGELVGSEMLARWEKPDGRVLLPQDFVPYAAAANLSVGMTHSLLQQVARDMKTVWAEYPDVSVSINLDEASLQDVHMVKDVNDLFPVGKVGAQNLIFEVPAATKLKKGDKGLNLLRGLRELGCGIAVVGAHVEIGDLKYARLVGANLVKLNAGFSEHELASGSLCAALEEIVAGADGAQITYSAQGVENRQQAALLRQAGIIQVQGFLMAPAMPVSRYMEMLNRMNSVRHSTDITDESVEEKKTDMQKAAAA